MTRRRSCASSREGYVGLQNHGSSDLIDYRRVKVATSTTTRASAAGAFAVNGNGPHVVEYRSSDL